jgi:hypothetical protein
LDDPETVSPEYNGINFAKIDFVDYSIRHGLLGDVQYVGWIDFGYLRTEKEFIRNLKINSNALFNDRVNMQVINAPPEHYNASHIVRTKPYCFVGNFLFGNQAAMLAYREAFHECVHHLHSQNLVDNDQHMQLCVYHNHPELVYAWHLPEALGLSPATGWNAAFALFHEPFERLERSALSIPVREFIQRNLLMQGRAGAAASVSPSDATAPDL